MIVLSAGGAPLDASALDTVRDATIVWVRVEREASAACLAARVRHRESPELFRSRMRDWGAARGWAVTVAPR